MAHVGFEAIAKKKSPALAYWIGVRKYGKANMQKAAAQHKPLTERQRLPEFRKKKGSAPNLPAYHK